MLLSDINNQKFRLTAISWHMRMEAMHHLGRTRLIGTMLGWNKRQTEPASALGAGFESASSWTPWKNFQKTRSTDQAWCWEMHARSIGAPEKPADLSWPSKTVHEPLLSAATDLLAMRTTYRIQKRDCSVPQAIIARPPCGDRNDEITLEFPSKSSAPDRPTRNRRLKAI